MQRRLETLLNKYDELHDLAKKDRYEDFEKTETQKIGESKDLEANGIMESDEK